MNKNQIKEEIKKNFKVKTVGYVIGYIVAMVVDFMIFNTSVPFAISGFIISIIMAKAAQMLTLHTFYQIEDLYPYRHGDAVDEAMSEENLKYSKPIIISTHIIAQITKAIGYFALSLLPFSPKARLVIILIGIYQLLTLGDNLCMDKYSFKEIFNGYITTVRKVKSYKK